MIKDELYGGRMISFLFFSALVATTADNQSSELGWGDKNTRLYFHYPPDPVNVRTLNFFLPLDQLSMPCFMPIEIKAAYNSYSGSSSIFGDKWTFNHNIRVRPRQYRYDVLEGDGFVSNYYKEKNLEATKIAIVDQLLIAKKKADVLAGGLKAASTYEDYRRQALKEESFRDEQTEKLLGGVKLIGPGTYYGLARGPSTLEAKADGSFKRNFQNGAYEVFDNQGRIIKSSDRNGNSIEYAYTGDNLSRINDMCGRYVSFTYQSDPALKNLAASIKDSLGREIKYAFFPTRRLKSVTDYNKKTTEFTYDKNGNMISLILPNPGESFSLEYNDKFEVVKQKGPGTLETRYERTFVANNINHSITKLSKYRDGKMTGQEVQEAKKGEFETSTKLDGAGKQIKKETRKISAETGYPSSILDESGQGDLFEYDKDSGNLMRREAVPSGEAMEFKYDAKCNQVSKITALAGKKVASEMTFTFDDRCNLKESIEMSGKEKRNWVTLKYTSQGKISFMTDQINNKEIAFTYWKYGKPESITLKDTGTLLVKYSEGGDIQKVDTFPNGKGTEQMKAMSATEKQTAILGEVRSVLDRLLNYLRPAGLNIGL